MRRAAGDDLAAFAALVRVHEAPLRRYLARLAGDEGDDLVAGEARQITAQRRFMDAHQRGEGGEVVPRRPRGCQGGFLGWARSPENRFAGRGRASRAPPPTAETRR